LQETRKILKDDNILVSATCVRVPTLKGHCEAVTLEFEKPIDSEKAGDILAEAPGIRLMDDTTINLYPQPRIASGTDQVLVGRVRQDAFNENGLVMWIVADNVRKGSALNMVQIAEEINTRGWLKPKGKK
jgi:aspartate-semialdehyde dehydrogenase